MAAVPQSSSRSAGTLGVDTSSRQRMMMCTFLLACPPENSCKAANKQVSLDSPMGIPASATSLTSWAEIREHHILLVACLDCFHATYPEVGNLSMSLYPEFCTFCKIIFLKEPFLRKICLELSHFVLHFTSCCYRCLVSSCHVA